MTLMIIEAPIKPGEVSVRIDPEGAHYVSLRELSGTRFSGGDCAAAPNLGGKMFLTGAAVLPRLSPWVGETSPCHGNRKHERHHNV